MNWKDMGLKLAKKASSWGLSMGIEAIKDLIFGTGISLEDAIKQIEVNTKRAILAARKAELEAAYNGLVMSLNGYINVPIEDSLTAMHLQVNNLIAQAEKLPDINPDKPNYLGLAGHPLYMVSANLKIAISFERMKIYKNFYEGEKKNLTLFLTTAITHANKMHINWREWVNSRFTPINCYLGEEFFNYFYKFDGIKYGAGSLLRGTSWIKEEMPPYEVIENASEATENRKKHIDKEMNIIEDEFINPSEKILVEWEKLAGILETDLLYNEFYKIFIKN